MGASRAAIPDPKRQAAVDYAKRFKWGFDNYVGGTDDWRCDAIRNYDEFGDEIDVDRDPCDCPECAGASAREFSRKMPLSIRVALNLANSQVSA